MFDIPAALKWVAIAAIVAGAIGTAWGIVRYIEHKAELALQVKALAELQQRQAQTVADKNRIWAMMLTLPDGRTRACAVKGPADGCCQPEPAECAP